MEPPPEEKRRAGAVLTAPGTPPPRPSPIAVALFGSEAEVLEREVTRHANLVINNDDPDVVICYGGDGTLLAAELQWPARPKVPILNSRRGHRCLPHPPAEVLEALSEERLHVNSYLKLGCLVRHIDGMDPACPLTALNEFNVHMGRINSAVRFRMWINDEPYLGGKELLGDGFVVATPFGSTAYFEQITHGVFTTGIGVAFKAVAEHTTHLVLPENTVVRARIVRGPAVLAHDSAQQYITMEEGDELTIQRHFPGATILTCGTVKRLDEPF